MDSSHPFVVRYKIHSNKEELPCYEICVIILCFIYVHNAITDVHIIYGSGLHHIINEYTDLILEITIFKYFSHKDRLATLSNSKSLLV